MSGRLSGGNNARIRIAVLDDYWHIARDSADWLSLDGASVVFCHDTLTDLDAIVERLQPYFVPVRPISYLRTSSRVLSGFTSRTCSALFIEIFISHLRVYRSSGLTLVQAKKSAIPGPRPPDPPVLKNRPAVHSDWPRCNMAADTTFGTDRADSGRAGTSFDKPPPWRRRRR